MNTEPNQKSLLRTLAQPFIAGLLALFPILLTLGIVIWLGSLIHRYIGPGSVVGNALREFGLNFATREVTAYLIGLASVLGLIFFLGLLIEAGMKRRWQVFSDFMLSRVPLINTIYGGAKMITQMVEPRDPKEMKSMRPVLCHFGEKKGTAIPAFLPTPETFEINGARYHAVMIPTAPVPFGGAILCVPQEWVTPMDCGIEGLLNIYISMGIAIPEYLNHPKSPAPRTKAIAPESTSEEW